MTVVGAGGVRLELVFRSPQFKKDYEHLDAKLQERTDDALKKLLHKPMPKGISFEKLKGYRNPHIYTIHVTGNFKISMMIERTTAILRRVASHDTIDRNP